MVNPRGMEIDLVTVEGSSEVFIATFIPKGQIKINNLELSTVTQTTSDISKLIV